MTIDYRPIEKRKAEEMFAALPAEAKWAEVTGALLSGQSIFIPLMTRSQLEVLRNIVNYRKFGRLRSRTVVMDHDGEEVEGKLLRMVRLGGG